MKEKPSDKGRKKDMPNEHGKEAQDSKEHVVKGPRGSAQAVASGNGWRAVADAQLPSAKPSTPIRKTSDARSRVRAKLMRAGVLATDLGIPHDLEPVSDEELERTGNMRPGARPSEELIDEDRGH